MRIKLEEENRRKNEDSNSLSKIKDLTSKIDNLGSGINSAGNFLNKNVNSEFAKNLGNNMSNIGGSLQKGAQSVSNTIDAPVNYFKGFAKETVSPGIEKAGQYLSSKLGLSGLGAGTTAGTTAGLGAGTTAAAGTAASGSAASGAAVNPLVALAVLAILGKNRKGASKAADSGLEQTTSIAQNANKLAQNDIYETQQKAAQMQAQANQDLQNGISTGAAAPVEENIIGDYQNYLRQNGYGENAINGVPQGLNNGDKGISEWINQYNTGAGRENPIIIPKTPEEIASAQAGTFNQPEYVGKIQQDEEIKNSLLSKFASGIGDFARGYEENKNNAFNENNLLQDKFADTSTSQSPLLTNYQNQLRNNGIEENIVNAVAQGKNGGNKDIANWISNNEAALKPVETTNYKDKSKMARLGEAAGSISRFAEKPAVQALLAGGISTALTGNPLYGLGMASKFANQRNNTNVYLKALQDQGINVNPGALGTLTNSDFASLMTPTYKKQENDLKKIYYENLASYRNGVLADRQQRTSNDKEFKAQKLTIDKQNANTKSYNATHKSSKSSKVESSPNYGNDLSVVRKVLDNPNISKTNKAKAIDDFIRVHKVDPRKKLSTSKSGATVSLSDFR